MIFDFLKKKSDVDFGVIDEETPFAIREAYKALFSNILYLNIPSKCKKIAVTSAISTDPINHEKMVYIRKEKIERIADNIPALEVKGNADADTLLVGWGGTFGHLYTATEELNKAGTPVAFAHFRYINPLPANTAEVFAKYKKVIVAELNTGQFADFLQSKFPEVKFERINKVQGQPFLVKEVIDGVTKIMEGK